MWVRSVTLETVVPSTGDVKEFVFRSSARLPRAAGQAGVLLVPGGGGKVFTIASGASDQALSVVTSTASGSRFKRALDALRPGDRVTVVGPVGRRSHLAPDTPQVLVAQGIGITPFLSMTRTQPMPRTTLLHVGPADCFDEVAAKVQHAEHHEHRADLQHALRAAAVAHPDAHWQVSGSRDFVLDTTARLLAAGVERGRVSGTAFLGLRPARTSREAVLR